MKWGGYNDKAAEKVTKFVSNLIGARGLYILLVLAMFILLSGAGHKFGP